MLLTISRDLSSCVRNVTRWVELTIVVCPMSVKATLEAVHGRCLNYNVR